MIKFLRLENGNLLNVNDVKEIVKDVQLNRLHDGGVKRALRATIELQTTVGRCTVIDVRVYAQLKEGESWSYDTEGGRRAIRRIDDILDTMLVLLIDKMNDENEKIIDIDTRFLEEAVQEEVERG